MEYKLYFDTTLVGEIKPAESDFPAFSGTFHLLLKPVDTLSTQIHSYIDFSVRLIDFYSGEEYDEEKEDKLLDEELQFENLIISESWKITAQDGQVIKILIPTFDAENVINWRLHNE